MKSVGLIKVERIKYSEKGREVKIFAPVRKLIVLVPEKTDRKSVADLIRKYLGIILTALFASSLIEFFMRKPGNNTKLMQTANESYSLPPPAISQLPAITYTPVGIVNKTIHGGDIAAANSTPIVPVLDSGEAIKAAPDIFTNLANTITAHPGLVFFMGCLFVIALFIIMDFLKKRKNG